MEKNKIKIKFLVLFAVILVTQIYLASALAISSATTNPNEVQPGEHFSLSLKVENTLNEDIENIIVSLNLNSQLPLAPYQSSNQVQIDRIDSGDSEIATFDLSALSSGISGTYLIPVQISYTLQSNGTDVKNENLGVVSVVINAQPKIDISSESILIKGTDGKISLKIVNSGLGDAKFLSISLSDFSAMQITSSNQVYIGNIDSNDFDTADFNVFVSSTASSSVNIPVELNYTDSGNNQITETKIISINAYTPEEAINLGLIARNNTFVIIISIAIVLIVFLIYRKIRKRNRTKRSNGQ